MLDGEKVAATSARLLSFVKVEDESFIERKESVRWGDYKKTLQVTDSGRVVTADGVPIPGMTCTQGEPSFYVEVTGL